MDRYCNMPNTVNDTIRSMDILYKRVGLLHEVKICTIKSLANWIMATSGWKIKLDCTLSKYLY